MRGLTGEEAADDRTQDAGGAEDREEVALVLGALTWRHDVADDGQRQGEEATGAQTLDGAEAAASWYIESARPHNAEPTMNSVMAVRNNGRRP